MTQFQWVLVAIALFGGVVMVAAAPYFWRTQPVEAQGATATTTRFTLATGTVAEGVVGEFPLRADTFPAGLSGFTIVVEPSTSTTTARVIGFDSPAYGLDRVDAIGVAPGGLRLTVADLAKLVNPGDFGVLLTTVRIEGLVAGTTDFAVRVIRADDDAGAAIRAIGVPGTVMVSASRDLDGDGLTEDFNGNGRFDFADINALFDLLLAAP